MKELLFPFMEERITFSKDKFYNVVHESPFHFRNFIRRIQSQLNGGDEFLSIYDEKDKKGNPEKKVFLISDFLTFEIDEKKINTLIQKEISSQLSDEEKEEYNKLIASISDYINQISYDYSIPLQFDEEIACQAFLKAFNLGIANSDMDFLESILYKIRVLNTILKYEVFILINPYDYFPEDEFDSFIKSLNQLEVNYLFISSHENKNKNPNEFTIIIDKDLCELHIEPSLQKD
ncbi:MAG: type II-A CRISPR-associated protein Csn2 [Bacilli bacterium]|nr:type II-A CRISPR-associated protein Csn2 [Bacilli bacterium]